MTDEPKGLRFEIQNNPVINGYGHSCDQWSWSLVGAEGVVCQSRDRFASEKEARSHIAANRGRLKAAGRSKVFIVEGAANA